MFDECSVLDYNHSRKHQGEINMETRRLDNVTGYIERKTSYMKDADSIDVIVESDD